MSGQICTMADQKKDLKGLKKAQMIFILRLHLLFHLTALSLTFEINLICDLAKENIIRHLSIELIELINAAWHF